MKEYRKLDDSIPMRLNRTIAQYRDMERTGSVGKGTIEDQACLQVWRELVGPYASLVRLWTLQLILNDPHIFATGGGCVANWGRRTRIINYCVDVLDTSYEENKLLADQAKDADLRTRRKAQAELYSADIKVRWWAPVRILSHTLTHSRIRCSAYTTPQ